MNIKYTFDTNNFDGVNPDNFKIGDTFINLNTNDIFLVVSGFDDSTFYLINMNKNKMYPLWFLIPNTYSERCKYVNCEVIVQK